MVESKQKKMTLYGTKEYLEKVKDKTFKLIDFDGSVLYSDKEKKGKIRWDLMGYTEAFSAPELLQNLSSFTEGDVEVNPKMDVWSAGITIFQFLIISKTKWPPLETHEKVIMVGQLFRCAKNSATASAKHGKAMDKQNANANQQSSISEQENEVGGPAELVLWLGLMKLPIECVHPGEKDWWKKYWEVIADILSIWTEVPEIVFLSVNMLSIEPEKRMTAKGAVDYLEGKCKPKEYEKNAEKMALFGDVSEEKLRKMMETKGFKSFLGIMKNEITEERKVRESEKKKKGEKKENGEKKKKGEKKENGEKREKGEKKEKMKSEKDFEKLENIKKRLVKEVEKSLQLFLKELDKRKEFCDQ
ncbi:hypothetical protein niasHT_020155 [Heterodera trifolii]